MRRHALDLDISAVLIAERMIGEILGWNLVDWPAVEPHKSRKFFFGRQRQTEPSIHDHLKPLFDRCDREKDDVNALKPSPVVNANLGKLVRYLCRHIGRHALPGGGEDVPALERTVEQDRLHVAVTAGLVERIDNNALLFERASRLKRIAAAAENELEKHFVDLINDRIESSFLPDGAPDRHKINSLRDQAGGRVAETRLLNMRELAGLSTPDLPLDDDALIRIEMAKILLYRFPYVRNYELMLLAELSMLQQPLAARFLPERRLGLTAFMSPLLLDRWDKALVAVSSYGGPSDAPAWRGRLHDRVIALCGSGPLPMSALFLHLFTGAAIILVDNDPAAVRRSRRLIANLERLDILAPGVLTVRLQNAGEVRFRSLKPAGKAQNEPSSNGAVFCDAVMIASLVDAEAKRLIVDQLARGDDAPAVLVIRSATGLSARLAYDPLPTASFSHGHLAYGGETVPASQIATHLDRIEAIKRGVVCAESPDLLAIAHPDVVNTTEIYRRIGDGRVVADLDLGACGTMEERILRLEAVAAALKVGKVGAT